MLMKTTPPTARISRTAVPLWVQLFVTLLVVTGLLSYVGGETIRSMEMDKLRSHTQYMAKSNLTIVAATTVDAVIAHDFTVLEIVANELAMAVEPIHSLEIINDREQTLLDWQRGTEVEEDILLHFKQPILLNGEQIGELRARWNPAAMYAEMDAHVDMVRRNIMVMMAIIAAVLMFWIHGLVIRPLHALDLRLDKRPEGYKALPWWVAREFRRLRNTVTRLEEMSVSNDVLEKEVERRKEAEVDMLAARDQALEASRAKSSFLANMSHELRTPLNAIIGYSELLREDAREEGRNNALDDLGKINTAGQHLLDLINEILDLSKIEAGKMDLCIEPVDLPMLIQTVMVTVEPMAERNGNQIRLEGLDDVATISTDVTKLRQVLLNLLSNAAKFTEHGEIVISGGAKTIDGVDGVAINISDSGIGLREEDIENLFQPFQQADVSISRKYGGTGLGLALCRRFCDMMGGDIGVQSEPGNGSTFSIWLPLQLEKPEVKEKAASLASQWTVDPKRVRLSGHDEQREGEPERRKRIATVLTIDDDPNVQDLMARVYNREGFRAIAASNGKEGIDLARKLLPDLITLDIMMPEMDGWTVLRALKDDPEVCDIPVIMVSMVEDRPMALEVGAMESLAKPIAWNRLLDLTRQTLRKESSDDAGNAD
jgi:signal transduction histidine kinase/ActR/RegA family two-component response regulator